MDAFRDSVAVITGASSGIGEGIAKMLADEGARVALVSRRQDELQRVAGEIRQSGGSALAIPADLSDDRSMNAMIEQVRTELGPVDILVNNGGVIKRSPIHQLDMQAWDETMAVNLRAPALLCAAVLPEMRERKRGYIINISSEAGVFVYGGMGAYAVSKHALRVLTELIQEENQDRGIKAWAICPGFVDTPMAGWAPNADRKRMLTVADVVDIVRFLLSQGPNVKMGPEILVRPARDPFSQD